MRSTMLDRFGDDLIVWVAPRKITGYVGDNVAYMAGFDRLMWRAPTGVRRTVTRVARRLGWNKPKDAPFFVPGRLYRRPIPLENLDKYRKVADLVERRDDYLRSGWFRSLKRKLERNGVATHKDIEMRSEAEVHSFFLNYALPLVDSITRDGYDVSKGRPFGFAMIGPNGDLHKGNTGDHRFFVARIVGAAPVPLRIAAVDRRWARGQSLRDDLGDVHRLIETVQHVAQTYGPQESM